MNQTEALQKIDQTRPPKRPDHKTVTANRKRMLDEIAARGLNSDKNDKNIQKVSFLKPPNIQSVEPISQEQAEKENARLQKVALSPYKDRAAKARIVKESKHSPQDVVFANTVLEAIAQNKSLEELGQMANMKPSKWMSQRVSNRLRSLGVMAVLSDKLNRMDLPTQKDSIAQLTRFGFDNDEVLLDPRMRAIAAQSIAHIEKMLGRYRENETGSRGSVVVKDFENMSPEELRTFAQELHEINQKNSVEAQFTVVEDKKGTA